MENKKRGKFLKRLKRLKQIVSLIHKYNIASYFIKLPSLKSAKKKKQINGRPIQVRLRLLFEELGPTFIKMGQVLSTQYDLIPREFCEEFQKLQDMVPPFPTKKAKEIIETELKRPISQLFDDFGETPVASASLSQVHKAKLKSGEVIAIKVQRLDIEENINLDFDLLFYLAKFVNHRIKALKNVDLVEIIEEARNVIITELDFNKELRNIETLYENLKHDPAVKIPKAYSNLTTSKVLVMEFIDGIKITNLEKIEQLGLDKKEIITNLIRTIYRQILSDGFFHGDPHPANVFVLEDGRIAFLDFGIVGYLDEKNKKSYIEQSKALARGDSIACIRIYAENTNYDMSSLDLEALEYDLDKINLDFFRQKIRSYGEFYFNVVMLMFDYGIPPPHQVVVLSRCLLTLSSLIRIYNISNEETVRIFIEALGEDEKGQTLLRDESFIEEFYNLGLEIFSTPFVLLKDLMNVENQSEILQDKGQHSCIHPEAYKKSFMKIISAKQDLYKLENSLIKSGSITNHQEKLIKKLETELKQINKKFHELEKLKKA